jgi:hypothetical protein
LDPKELLLARRQDRWSVAEMVEELSHPNGTYMLDHVQRHKSFPHIHE